MPIAFLSYYNCKGWYKLFKELSPAGERVEFDFKISAPYPLMKSCTERHTTLSQIHLAGQYLLMTIQKYFTQQAY